MAVGRDAGELAGIAYQGVKVVEDLAAAVGQFDVLIDFTRPEPSMNFIEICRQAGKKIVIGTTGYSEEQKAVISEAAKDIAIVLAPNMSVGVNLSLKLLEMAAKVMGDYTDIEIIEAHHHHKKDAPSGTAVKLARVLSEARNRNLEDVGVYCRHGMIGPRKREEIGIQTIRAGDITGEHTVIFGGIGERIEVTHKAHNRDNFARGAVRAAKWIINQDNGLYDMQDVLGLR